MKFNAYYNNGINKSCWTLEHCTKLPHSGHTQTILNNFLCQSQAWFSYAAKCTSNVATKAACDTLPPNIMRTYATGNKKPCRSLHRHASKVKTGVGCLCCQQLLSLYQKSIPSGNGSSQLGRVCEPGFRKSNFSLKISFLTHHQFKRRRRSLPFYLCCMQTGTCQQILNIITVWVSKTQHTLLLLYLFFQFFLSQGTFHFLELTGQTNPIVMRISFSIKTIQPHQSTPKRYAQRRWVFSDNSWKKLIALSK